MLALSLVQRWPHTRIGIGRFWELCPQYIGVPSTMSLCRYCFDISLHIGFPGVSRGQLLKLQKNHAVTDIDYIVVPLSILVG